MSLTYHIFTTTIVISYKNKTITIPKGDPRFDKVLKLINKGELNQIPLVADRENINKIKALLKLD
jgi:hypothetical protein